MLYLMKVYRQQEIHDGGLKKGNALSLTVILAVAYCIHQISSYTSHRNIIPTTISMFVRSVESIAIDIYATQPQKKPGNSYHNRHGRLFYLGSHSHYTVYFNDNFDVC